jgi:penicillin amidase
LTVRVVRTLALVLVLLLTAGVGSAAYLVRRAFPQTAGTLVVGGLQAPVEVVRDRWGVPHVYARTEHDLFFAQGFVHAQDRLWQMEVNRRTASGRLSEWFGERTLAADRFLRTLGLRHAAALEWRLLSADSQAALRAYAAGVNAFLRQSRGRLPLEFALLRTAPEPWSPVDSLAFGKLVAYELGGNWQTELLRADPVPVLGRLLGLGPFPTPGDGWTVNQTAYSLLRPFHQTVVASMRMVVDLADPDRSAAVHTTGQSGLPGHPRRADLAPLWASGRYHPLLWSREAVDAHARSRLELRPGP